MKKYTFFVLLFFVSTYISLAQNIKTTLIEAEENIKLGTSSGDEFVKVGNNYYQVNYDIKYQFGFSGRLKNAKHTAELIKYDLNLKKIGSKKLTNNGSEKFGPLHSVSISLKDKFFFVFTEFDDSNDEMKFFAGEIDVNNFTIINKKYLFSSIIIDESALKMLFSNSKFSYRIVLNENKSTVTVACISLAGKDVRFVTFDENLNTIGNKEKLTFTMPKVSVFSDFSVDADNNKYFLTNLPEEESEKKEKLINVFIVNTNGKATQITVPKPTKDTLINKFYFENSLKKDVKYLVCGYTTALKNKGFEDGVYIFTLNGTNNNISNKYHVPYTLDLKQRLAKIDFGRRDKDDYHVYPISFKIKELNNNKLFICGQTSLVEVREYQRSSGGTTTTYKYYTGPLLAGFLSDKECDFKLILKYTQSNPGRNIPIVDLQHNKIRIVYMDGKKNIENDINSNSVIESKGIYSLSLACAEFSIDGNFISKKMILGEPAKNCEYNLADAIKEGSNKFYIPISKLTANFAEYIEKLNQILLLEFE